MAIFGGVITSCTHKGIELGNISIRKMAYFLPFLAFFNVSV